MRTGIHSLLQLIWLASPALPVGGFSYSEGLEAAIERGLVHDAPSATEWLQDQLMLSLARSDLAVLAQALQTEDAARLLALNAWVQATRESAELRLQTEQMGRSLHQWQQSLQGVPSSASTWTYPLAFAQAARSGGAPVRDTLMAYAFGWAENQVQAAVKTIPLGQSAGQRILAQLAQHIPAAVDHAMSLDDNSRQAFTPMLAILSAQHETQYSRLFRS
jgi:urease accessory protein